MKSPINKEVKEYFNFSKKDRNGILFLFVLILLAFTALIVIENFQPEERFDNSEMKKIFEEFDAAEKSHSAKTLFSFDPNLIDSLRLDSLDIPDFVKKNILRYRKAGGYFSEAKQVGKIYGMNDSIFALVEPFIQIEKSQFKPLEKLNKAVAPADVITGTFDPNSADAETLMRFGFSRFQADNMVKYRAKGGVFHKSTDLLKIFGIDSMFYISISKFILVSEPELNVTKTTEIIEINTADKLAFEKLAGVGPVFAGRIVKYRTLLGGFYSKGQLLEVFGFSPELLSSIDKELSVDTSGIKKIKINFADYNELVRHPYLTKEQVKAILNQRDKAGAFKNTGQLRELKIVDAETYNKIFPYLTCR